MTKPRDHQVDLDATPYYHCYVRCVRRAFLCGDDYSTGENFDHRKQWIVSRLKFLSYVFSIDICAYAVMSNHYHVVLHVDRERAESWSLEEVVERWTQLFKSDVLVDQWLRDPEGTSPAVFEKVLDKIETWRKRLYGLDWFMRCTNETIARMANEEENCKGRFWEGRYKSQALLDETALLSCMAYVDLNPVRAGMADDLVVSDFTSIQRRIHEYAESDGNQSTIATQASKTEHRHRSANRLAAKAVLKTTAPRIEQQDAIEHALKLHKLPKAALMPFDGSSHTSIHNALPFTLEDYFDLVDTTGRAIRDDKRGYIKQNRPTLLSQFDIDPDGWLDHVLHFTKRFGYCAGTQKSLMDFAASHQRAWVKGTSSADRYRQRLNAA